MIESLQSNEELLEREIAVLKEQLNLMNEAALRGEATYNKEASILARAPIVIPKKSLAIKGRTQDNVTFKTIGKNLDELQDQMKAYELEET
jgi:exonuclease I